MAIRPTPPANVNPAQFAMFMSSRDITNRYEPNPADHEEYTDYDHTGTRETIHEETAEMVWGRKYEESVDSGLYDRIKQEGVQRPVNLNDEWKTVGNGHHRIAAMSHIDPEALIPVLHHSDVYGAVRGGYAHDSHEWAPLYNRYPIGAGPTDTSSRISTSTDPEIAEIQSLLRPR